MDDPEKIGHPANGTPSATVAERPWFTADEIPQPPPAMRLPPGETEPSLFDDQDDD